MSANAPLHVERRGTGKPLLLVHGLGGSWESWLPVVAGLEKSRELIMIDLPGFGNSAPLDGEVTIAALADAVEKFLRSEGLTKIDTVGSSMGARIVLELARRGVGGDTVALDPGGFWSPGELRFFSLSLKASLPLVLGLQPALPTILGNPVGRTALLVQFSAAPWKLPKDVAVREMRGFAKATALNETLNALVNGPLQEGAPAGTTPGRVTIGWGRQDRVTLPSQAARAQEKFPDAEIYWFEKCGHFPMWDQPEETVDLILRRT
ncbi:alpha/beta fold hydrolase [Hoyosella rhizosphaerae]|uniref:Hydrolase n=1 Tax=Hoyosella rhizosphaerae TaxID=1755582 RepID=A0A916XJM5_9ACTN|nr:alpha/beta fold hydrolase [Hoyosella rhizosphaerae]MBN4925428.1 alpha/beta fold hydrolase [Hoyosella rhizosphaerae]GGC75265.1 hydrolase [Hoyosella rhizosphaerae]